MKKPKKWAVIFVAMALIGTNLEMAARAWTRDLICPETMPVSQAVICRQGLSAWSLAGWSSLWMLFAYGFAGLVLGAMNENRRIARLPMLLQCLLAAVFATSFELLMGLLLNVTFRLQVWDYRGETLEFMRQISLRSFVSFFAVSPLAFWIDDAIRYLAYGEKPPAKLAAYYRRLFQLRAPELPVRLARRSPPPHRRVRRRLDVKRRATQHRRSARAA